ncbi:hypothetical protein QQF64_004806 [Cirrhinus molitorella]|uniref:Uncharacterized protein n=1 Tax=Cirrhinus molitorella TaxID=172907 RepID=A0ABR3MJH4_9TELE
MLQINQESSERAGGHFWKVSGGLWKEKRRKKRIVGHLGTAKLKILLDNVSQILQLIRETAAISERPSLWQGNERQLLHHMTHALKSGFTTGAFVEHNVGDS